MRLWMDEERAAPDTSWTEPRNDADARRILLDEHVDELFLSYGPGDGRIEGPALAYFLAAWGRIPGTVTVRAAELDLGDLIVAILIADGGCCVIAEPYPRSSRSRFPRRRRRRQ